MVKKSKEQQLLFSYSLAKYRYIYFWHFSLPSGRYGIGFSGLAIAVLVVLGNKRLYL